MWFRQLLKYTFQSKSNLNFTNYSFFSTKNKMAKTVKLYNGNEMPVLGLGTWKSPVGQVYEAVKIAVEAGYRHIDCALIYGNEKEIGKALSEVIQSGKVKREELFITSKLWNTYHSKKNAAKCLEQTLNNLRLDYLDLYLIHWPTGYQEDGELFPKDSQGNVLFSDVDYLESWHELENFVDQGKVKSIGLSNFNSQQIDRIIENSKIQPAVDQIECHPYLSQKQLIEFCKQKNIVTAYSPLGSPDRPWAKPDDVTLLEEPKVKELAAKYNKNPGQILIKFQIQRGVVVIPKSVTRERIISNFNVFDFELTNEDVASLESLDRGLRFCPLYAGRAHKYYPFSVPF